MSHKRAKFNDQNKPKEKAIIPVSAVQLLNSFFIPRNRSSCEKRQPLHHASAVSNFAYVLSRTQELFFHILRLFLTYMWYRVTAELQKHKNNKFFIDMGSGSAAA